MIISEKTWPLIEARLNKLEDEKKKTKQQESEVLGQKPVNYETRKEKSLNENSQRL